jgi:predicted nucleic acid-binding protein
VSLYIVDSSVVIKWFTPEAFTVEAKRIRSGPIPLHAPEFLDIEVAAIVWKKIRRGVMTRAEGDFILSELPLLSITRHPTGPIVAPAFDLADLSGRTVYDCLFLALAVQLGGVMVTADEKLVNALVATSWAAHITKLKDIP